MLPPPALEAQARSALDAVGRALFITAWPEVPVRWNRRLRRAGRAVIEARNGRFEAAAIELSPSYFEVYPDDLAGILIHEAVHVGLALQGRPFGHGAAFQSACRQAGGLLHSRWLPGRVFRYRCPTCAAVLERRRRAADSRWCAECVARAEAAGEDPFAPARALQLVGTAYCGPEGSARAPAPACEAPSDAAPLR